MLHDLGTVGCAQFRETDIHDTATALAATQDCVAFKVSIVSVWVIERVMEAAAFLAAQRRIDNQGGYSCKIT
jgi:hypothetical protein